MKRCAENPAQGEYTLCGVAWDAPDSEDDVEPFVMAKDDESITCLLCCRVIRIVKAMKNPLKPRKE